MTDPMRLIKTLRPILPTLSHPLTDPTDPITPYDQSYEIDRNPMTDPTDTITPYY